MPTSPGVMADLNEKQKKQNYYKQQTIPQWWGMIGGLKKMKLYFILLISLMTGCSGQMVCEWQTENEQFKELIEQAIEDFKNAQTKNVETTESQKLQAREQSTPSQYQNQAGKGRAEVLKSCRA